MFLGHLAVGFGAKRVAPRASLGTLLLATLWCDVVCTFFLLTGLERARIDPSVGRYFPVRLEYFPWSHSLVTTLLWAMLMGGIYYAARRYRPGAWWIGALVASHWILDWASHRPDMTLSPGFPEPYGLGLYHFPVATFVVEALMFAMGVGMYLRGTTPRDTIGRWAVVTLVILLSLMYIGSFFSPAPPSVRAMALANSAIGPVLLWAAWADRHRAARVTIRACACAGSS